MMRVSRLRGTAGSRSRRGLSSARERFELRAARARRRPLLLASLVVGVLLLGGALVWLGWFSSLLLAQRVEVVGVPQAATRVVRDVAAVPLGRPLMRVDTGAVAQRLEQDRRWADVAVSRRLPHTVIIEVTPRVAVVAVRTSSGRFDLYDREATAFQTVATAPEGLPVVASASGGASADGIRAALEALAALQPALRESVTSVSLSTADRVTLQLSDEGSLRTVVWGGPGEADLKARLVAVLLKEPGRTIDVTVPDSPVTR